LLFPFYCIPIQVARLGVQVHNCCNLMVLWSTDMTGQETRRPGVAAATDDALRLKLLQAIQESAGIWEDENHPELATPEDIDRWLRRLRSHWRHGGTARSGPCHL
jgi:hypothetical protein